MDFVDYDDIKLAKVVGENEEGMTLFVPKDMDGEFELEDGDRFLTLLFIKNVRNGAVTPYTPWE